MKFSIFNKTAHWCESQKLLATAVKETSSTNELAKIDAAQDSNLQKIFVTDFQTRGRGRSKNTWLNTQPGDALYATWSFLLNQMPQVITAPIFGLAVFHSFKKTWPDAPFYMKAPNDIYLNHKKVCGILLETINVDQGFRLISGIGINVFSHPLEVDFATHLSEHLEVSPELWNTFLNSLNEELREASHSALGSHLTLEQRERIQLALNANNQLKSPFTSISPFGDLTNEHLTISWRDL